jgi:ABC-type glycerol-3-phosphate transport system substrate-binding protein
MRYRFLSTAIAVSLASAALAACGSSSSSSAGSSLLGATSSSSAYTGNVRIDCTGKKPITLHVLTPEDEGDTTVRDFQKAFPCIKLSVDAVPFADIGEKIQVAASSSTPPDIYYYDGPNTADYAYNGVIMPLDKYIDPAHKSELLRSIVEQGTYDGKLYSAGLGESAIALFYNKTMTDAAGVYPPTTLAHAWTWSQAIAAFKKVEKGPASHPSVYALAASQFGNGTPGNFYRDGNMLRSMGNPKAPDGSSAYDTFQGISDNGKTVNGYVNTPEDVAGAKVFQSLYSEGLEPKTGAPDMWLDGKAAFDLDGYYVATEAEQQTTKTHGSFKWGITPLPYFKTPIVQTGDDTIGVSAKTKYPAEAAAFALFATSLQEQKNYFADGGGLPVLKSLYQTPSFTKYPLDIFSDELAQWGRPRPTTPVFAFYDNEMSMALNNIALGADPKSALDKAASEIDQQLDDES